ncbi:hypothetical protein [Bacillus inaquosorum]|uniref:hypothetical protein n=1 Tax=Bacillus inaquosorum TaxID=483913 RepID=UPI0022813107|nr:hypothetical protein [Bacillus inaquosorum]MCY9398073.1 hypothetical protein [Bacillus inaquosorum]
MKNKIELKNTAEKELISFRYSVKDKEGIFPTLEGDLTAISKEVAKSELMEYYTHELGTAPEALEITISVGK